MDFQNQMDLVFGNKIQILPEDMFPTELQVINFVRYQLESKSY